VAHVDLWNNAFRADKKAFQGLLTQDLADSLYTASIHLQTVILPHSCGLMEIFAELEQSIEEVKEHGEAGQGSGDESCRREPQQQAALSDVFEERIFARGRSEAPM
jgi:hypothetical protein